MKVVALKCAGCGAVLDITLDMDQFACGYCGLNQRVERSGGTVSLRRLEAAVRQIETASHRTAAELAYPRLKRELGECDQELKNLLASAHHGLPTRTNWWLPVMNIGYYCLGFFALALLFSGKLIFSGFLGLLWLFCLAEKDAPAQVLTAASLLDLAERKKQIEKRMALKKADLQQGLEADRRVMDGKPPLVEVSSLPQTQTQANPNTAEVVRPSQRNAALPEPLVYIVPASK